jgi:tripartite-type tricarboxylate transporter receptor subunit TctC
MPIERRMVASGAEEIFMRLLSFLLAASLSLSAAAQDWPRQKPIHIIVGFPPGSTTDLVARLAAPKLSEALGQSVVVDNRPGAAGNVAAQQIKRAAPDGYTLYVTSVAFAVNPSLYANAGYDPQRDFVPVILAPSTPNIITVHLSVPATNLQELIALARKQLLSYASSGIGTTTHLSVERIKTQAKVDITHVPYTPAAAVGAAVGGHTQISSTSMPPAVPQVKAGRVRPIAVTSAQRSPALPDVPTVNEQGFSGFDDLTWTAFFAPAGTAPEIVNRLNSELNRAFAAPEVRERLAQVGLDWSPNTPAQFGTFLRSEIDKWAQAVKESGAKAE